MISEEQKQRPSNENKHELDDVLDELAMKSPQTPESELSKLGTGASKKIPSLGLTDQKPLIANVTPMRPKMNHNAEVGSLQSSPNKSLQVEIVNDKEICQEAESSSDDDLSTAEGRTYEICQAIKTNKSLQDYVNRIIKKEISAQAKPIFREVMKENQILVEDYLHTKGALKSEFRNHINSQMARNNRTPNLKLREMNRFSKTP